jgi:hypothetical protein
LFVVFLSFPCIFLTFISAPPTNQSTFHQWTVGALYYSALVMAEVIGPSNNTQVINYGVGGLSSYTPIYNIYENGTPVRVAIFNYIDDPSGTNTVHAVISLSGATMPSSVKVKYLAATTVVQKGGYTWAGQVRRLPHQSMYRFHRHSAADVREEFRVRWAAYGARRHQDR